MSRFWVGADPGGKNNFGLAFLDAARKSLDCATVSSVNDAVEQIVRKGVPLGLGIDAPMWWSSREGAGRKADDRIRTRYRILSGTVQSANSLKGAALVGGMMLALRIREKFPDTRITKHTQRPCYMHSISTILALQIDSKLPSVGVTTMSGTLQSAPFVQGRGSRGAGRSTWLGNVIRRSWIRPVTGLLQCITSGRNLSNVSTLHSRDAGLLISAVKRAGLVLYCYA